MIVYADILFAVNFSMDFISLFITFTFLNKKINKARILIASSVGGVYGVLDLLLSLNPIIGIVLNITVSFLMCAIVYNEKSIRRFFSFYVIYIGISLTLAGFMSVFYSFLNKILSKYILEYTYEKAYNGARFFIISSLSIILAIIFGRVFTKEKVILHTELEVELKTGKYKLEALCDTGNTLKDVLTGKNVILVTKECTLGRDIESIPDIYKKYIPYQATNNKGILKGIIPKKILIDGKNIDAIIAPVENKSFAGYDGCIPYALK